MLCIFNKTLYKMKYIGFIKIYAIISIINNYVIKKDVLSYKKMNIRY